MLNPTTIDLILKPARKLGWIFAFGAVPAVLLMVFQWDRVTDYFTTSRTVFGLLSGDAPSSIYLLIFVLAGMVFSEVISTALFTLLCSFFGGRCPECSQRMKVHKHGFLSLDCSACGARHPMPYLGDYRRRPFDPNLDGSN